MTVEKLFLAIFLTVSLSWMPGDASAETASKAEIKRIVVQEAMRSQSVAPALALAVAEVESDFRADAESHAGARGVMQLMPKTAKGEFGVEADELWEPRLNIQLGIAFLDELLDRYDGRLSLALSHYNGGSAVRRGGVARVIPATRGYVRRVLKLYRHNRSDASVVRLVRSEGAANPALKLQLASRVHLEDEPGVDADWKRYLDVASAALKGADNQAHGRDGVVDSSAALARLIEATKRRFRNYLTRSAG